MSDPLLVIAIVAVSYCFGLMMRAATKDCVETEWEEITGASLLQ